jgi:hypothetical protein
MNNKVISCPISPSHMRLLSNGEKALRLVKANSRNDENGN